MDELTVRSTSNVSAEVSDVVLRETSTTRFVFRPMPLDNQKRPDAAVKGAFVFQQKSLKQSWDAILAEPLSSLKKGEGYKLALDSAETLRLFQELSSLYELYSKEGIPTGHTAFVRARGACTAASILGPGPVWRYARRSSRITAEESGLI